MNLICCVATAYGFVGERGFVSDARRAAVFYTFADADATAKERLRNRAAQWFAIFVPAVGNA